MPADLRRKLGVGPGSLLEWEEEGEKIFVRRVGRFTSEDIHQALLGARSPKKHSTAEMKEGIRRYVRGRYARP